MAKSNKYIKKLNEQFAAEPKEAPTKTPTKTPTRRRRPGPIRRDKPSVKPNPKASAEDLYDRFIKELRASKGSIDFDIKKLTERYGVTESEVVLGFAEFINEASLEDNPGLPDGYKSDVANRAAGDTRAIQGEMGNKIQQFMGIVQNVLRLQESKKSELEELAEDAIRHFYGDILDGVDLDIKFPDTKGEIPDMMSDVPDRPEMEEITDPETIKEIHKRKISNNITQGEAKNTKLILNDEFITDGLKRIFGDEDGKKMVEYLNDITKIAGFYDWSIPEEVQKEMWQNKDGFAGSVKVDWEEEEDEDDNEENQRTAEDILNDLENGEDLSDTDAEELFDDIDPKIIARGNDFAMLIHETVKGIYELISAVGIPENEELAGKVIMNTDTLADEIEDLRYGPYIAADLRDFINEFNDNGIGNIRERIFGKIIALPADDFLNLIKNILMKSASAKTDVQNIIDEIKEELDEYDNEGFSADSYGDDDADDVNLDGYDLPNDQDEAHEIDDNLEDKSNSEIQDLIDIALDSGDFAKIDKLVKYLKESLEAKKGMSHVLGRSEFETINENRKAAEKLFISLKRAEYLRNKK